MSEKIIELTVESIEHRLKSEVNAFQPKEERESFILNVEDTTVVINAAEKTFTPVNRGNSDVYMDLKEFFNRVGLEYRSYSVGEL